MHGMTTDEELDYWRERASKAEQELAGAEGELDGLRVSEAFHRDRCDKLEMAAVRKLLPKEQDSFKGCCPLCALREVDYTDEATRLVTADRDYWKQRASGAELSHSTALASLAVVTAERDEAREDEASAAATIARLQGEVAQANQKRDEYRNRLLASRELGEQLVRHEATLAADARTESERLRTELAAWKEEHVEICAQRAEWLADRDAAVAESERLRTALTKISAIRDSIVGMQGFNFSEHAYPLVAALGEAGFDGAGYEIARKNLGTLIEQRDAADAESERLRGEVERMAKDAAYWRQVAAERYQAIEELHAELGEPAQPLATTKGPSHESDRAPDTVIDWLFDSAGEDEKLGEVTLVRPKTLRRMIVEIRERRAADSYAVVADANGLTHRVFLSGAEVEALANLAANMRRVQARAVGRGADPMYIHSNSLAALDKLIGGGK